MLYGRKRKKDAQWKLDVLCKWKPHDMITTNYLGNVMPDYTGGITFNSSHIKIGMWLLELISKKVDLYHSVTDMFSMAAGLHEWTAGL